MQVRPRAVSLLILLAILLTACGGAAAPAVVQTVEPAAPTAEPAVPTEAIAPTEAVTPTEAAEVPTSEGEGLLLGELSPMTGAGAAFGESHHNGVLMAVDEINANGGIPGIGPI